ncbi:hypothetical protein GR925_31205 [Streptomyces sp. HUCO-GS316]|uniref:hypothetical protein n=1 Tax=Streptomyces sp. HUCO-GS316 TaxID=2692198 RepID=UPI00136E96BF|nr:hypothetical protein [Streptomyces sp. HUCO-GS316]MXM67784.1 hypothetical protein [Streptomyces sp. HUCO-GS316]
MGVFARLFRRSKITEEAHATEAPAGSGAVADEDTAEAQGSAEAGTVQEPTATDAGRTPSDESVEIPKQQSADTAADSEAAEDART